MLVAHGAKLDTRDHGSREGVLDREQTDKRQSGRDLRAVEQCEPFLRLELYRFHFRPV